MKEIESESEGQNANDQNRGLQRVTSDLHKNVRASPFESSYAVSESPSQASETSTSQIEGLQTQSSSLRGLKSLKSKMSYQGA